MDILILIPKKHFYVKYLKLKNNGILFLILVVAQTSNTFFLNKESWIEQRFLLLLNPCEALYKLYSIIYFSTNNQ